MENNQKNESWKVKHADARAFYSVNKERLMEIWRDTQGEKLLTPGIWAEFVDSQSLWDITISKMKTLSQNFWSIASFSEDPMEGDMAYAGNESYRLMPFKSATIPFSKIGTGASIYDIMHGTPHYACQQFLKTVLLYMFADVYPNEFAVNFMHSFPMVNKKTIDEPL